MVRCLYFKSTNFEKEHDRCSSTPTVLYYCTAGKSSGRFGAGLTRKCGPKMIGLLSLWTPFPCSGANTPTRYAHCQGVCLACQRTPHDSHASKAAHRLSVSSAAWQAFLAGQTDALSSKRRYRTKRIPRNITKITQTSSHRRCNPLQGVRHNEPPPPLPGSLAGPTSRYSIATSACFAEASLNVAQRRCLRIKRQAVRLILERTHGSELIGRC